MLTSSSSLALLKLEKYDSDKDTNWMLAYVVVVDDVNTIHVADGCHYLIYIVVVVLRRCR